jgi:hypothetical protein
LYAWQTLRGFPMAKLSQTSAHLTQIGSTLYELIRGHQIIFYDDDDIRLAMSHAIAVESGSGWKITKGKSRHKVDVVVAMAMACHACMESQSGPQPFIPTDELVRVSARPSLIESYGKLEFDQFGNPGERTLAIMRRAGRRW